MEGIELEAMPLPMDIAVGKETVAMRSTCSPFNETPLQMQYRPGNGSGVPGIVLSCP